MQESRLISKTKFTIRGIDDNVDMYNIKESGEQLATRGILHIL